MKITYNHMAAAALIAVVCLAGVTAQADTFHFDDIDAWAGTGNNRAAMVIDWNLPGVSTLVFGYRWEGTATGRDMMNAVETLMDGRLYEESGYGGGTVYGISWDNDGDGVFDWHRAGWFDGFWSYWVSNAGVSFDTTTDTWGYSGAGIAGRNLTDGAWDGWSWDPNFAFNVRPTAPFTAAPDPNPSVPPIPEPATLTLLGLGIAGLAARRMRRE